MTTMGSGPVVDGETRPYWDAIDRGELCLQQCGSCERWIFYPRFACPHCFSTDLRWRRTSGTGVIHTFTVVRKAFGEFAEAVPFVVALVDLSEGVRMMSRIICEDPESVRIGDEVEVEFVRVADDVVLPWFRPARILAQPQEMSLDA